MRKRIVSKLRPFLPIFSGISIFGVVPVLLTTGALSLCILAVQLIALFLQLLIVFTDE